MLSTTQVSGRRPPGLDLTLSTNFKNAGTTRSATTPKPTPTSLKSPGPNSVTSPFSALFSAKFAPAGLRTPGKAPYSANLKTPLSSFFQVDQAFVVSPQESYFDDKHYSDELEPPLLTRKALRIVPLPPTSPLELSCFTPVSVSRELKADLNLSQIQSQFKSEDLFEPDAALSPLWDKEGLDEDSNLFTSGLFGDDSKFWLGDADYSDSSSSEESSDDDDDTLSGWSDSDSNFARSGSPPPSPNLDEFSDVDSRNRVRGYTTTSPSPSSLLFCIYSKFNSGVPLGSCSEDDTKEPSALVSLSTTLAYAIPIELQDALAQGVKLDYNASTSHLGVVIGEKQDWTHSNSTEIEGSALGPPRITSLSVSVVHSLGSLEESMGASMAMKTQYQLLLCVLSWALAEFWPTLESVSVELPEAFSLPKNCLHIPDAAAMVNAEQPWSHTPMSRCALHTLAWTGDLDFLPGVLRCISPQAVRGIQTLKVNSEVSVDDALLLLGRFAGPESGLHSVELSGAGVGAYSPSLLPEYLESESEFDDGQVNSGIGHSCSVFVSESPSPSSKKIFLPKLDTLSITATVSLDAFFAAVDLPRLCKLELDLGDAGNSDATEETLGVLLGTTLIPSSGSGLGHSEAQCSTPGVQDGLLFLDVMHGGGFEIGERLRGHVLQRSPSAYISINGE